MQRGIGEAAEKAREVLELDPKDTHFKKKRTKALAKQKGQLASAKIHNKDEQTYLCGLPELKEEKKKRFNRIHNYKNTVKSVEISKKKAEESIGKSVARLRVLDAAHGLSLLYPNVPRRGGPQGLPHHRIR